MNFSSDNAVGAHPRVLEALAAANDGAAAGYGADDWTAAVDARLAEIFEREITVFEVATGSAANGLALAALAPPYGRIYCHEASHIQLDECSAPEFFTGGAKLVPLPGADGKLSAKTLAASLAAFPARPPHSAPASVLSLTQASEYGTLYSLDETGALADIAKAAGMAVHMDGARFSNALAALGRSPAEATWKAGVDVLCLGATKNGCMAAEVVIFFDPDQAGDFAYRRKRAGHLWSKSRFLSAQLDAWLQGDLWLDLARHANAAAARLAGVLDRAGVAVPIRTEINEVFALLDPSAAAALQSRGAQFYPWVCPGDAYAGRLHRFVTSWATANEEIDAFADVLSSVIG